MKDETYVMIMMCLNRQIENLFENMENRRK